jgi:hypothetical protein
MNNYKKSPNGLAFRNLPEPFQHDEIKSYCDGDFGRIDKLPEGLFRVYDSWKDLWHPFTSWGAAFGFFKYLAAVNGAKARGF